MSASGTPATWNGDDCPLCDGTGEIEARTSRAERDQVGCPMCIEQELQERIAGRKARIDDAQDPAVIRLEALAEAIACCSSGPIGRETVKRIRALMETPHG